MLALAATNSLAAVLFGLIYAAAGTRWMTQGAFLVSLAVFFVATTALWVRVERSRPGDPDPISRIGRASVAVILVVLGLPALVLAPLFALQETLPPTAGFPDVIRPVMVLLLISVTFMGAVNVVGAGVLLGSALRAALVRRSPRGP